MIFALIALMKDLNDSRDEQNAVKCKCFAFLFHKFRSGTLQRLCQKFNIFPKTFNVVINSRHGPL